MNPTLFSVLVVDLATGRARAEKLEGRSRAVGGSGLAALLFERFGHPDRPWHDPDQPFILAIGPLTGLFPLMSKTVSAYVSPYHGQYTESHAGGRSALALRFAGYDALVLTGRAPALSCVVVSERKIRVRPVPFMAGMDVLASGKLMRRMLPAGSGHRSILRIGPAGENGSAMACVNVDTYRHFGRLGGGAVLGRKNVKGIVITGEEPGQVAVTREYRKLFSHVYNLVTGTDMLRKYHNLGTPANLEHLNDLAALPWQNLQKTSDARISGVTGTCFADQTLLRNGACSGCPVGCIHIGFIRERFEEEHNRYLYHQVAYDYEPIFAAGTMLGLDNAFDVLRVLDAMERQGLDAMSAGVALAWATEAADRGLISDRETVIPLAFGDADGYVRAASLLGGAANDFYRLLGQGTLACAREYGGEEFACVLGQEMAGYATGEVFFAAQALGFRHSHLDTGAYSYDQKHDRRDLDDALLFLLKDEPGRCLLTSMVSCLFARSVYTPDLLGQCLSVTGFGEIADHLDSLGEAIRRHRWQLRFATGFRPEDIVLPKRFYRVSNWKGPVDADFLDRLKTEYGRRLTALVQANPEHLAENSHE